MTNTLFSPRLKSLKRAMPFVALAMSAGFVAAPAWAQTTAPRAGTSIGNQATATYNDGSSIPRDVQSNSVTTLVQQVAGVDLTDPRTINAAPGAPIAFPHTIQNTGNGNDSFNIGVAESTGDDFNIGYQVFADANQDGVPDNNTPITVTPSLQPGEKFNFVVVGTVPANQAATKNASITVTATSTTTSTTNDANADKVIVTSNAVINVVKSVSAPVINATTKVATYTYTLTYTNNSNVNSGAVALSDTLDARLAYKAASGLWSVSGPTALGDNAGNADDPTGITYARNAQLITATIANVPARSTGRVSFSVDVAPTTAPGLIPNFATFAYDDDNDGNTATTGTPSVNGTTNTVDVNVGQTPLVAISSDSKGPVAQGSTVVFTNTVTNNGNGTDVFNITLTPSGTPFPAGTVFQLFQPGGAAALLDSNGDGIPDTGPLAPRPAGTPASNPVGTYNVVVKAILPPTTSGTGPYVQNVIATSTTGAKPAATGTDTVTSITKSAVDITNRTGGQPTGGTRIDETTNGNVTPVLALAGNPGSVVIFPLSANNKSAVNDNYALSFVPNPALPAGFSVAFKDTTGKVITNTGNIAPVSAALPAGGFFDYYAEVTIPANATPQQIALAFAITSGASGATDTVADQLTVNPLNALSIAPNNQGQVFPGSSVNYAHVITNDGNTPETNIVVTATDSLAGFSSVIYADTNGNGILDPAEQTAGPLKSTDIPTLAVKGDTTPGAKSTFPIIVVVFGPSNQFTSGAVDTTTVTATSAGGRTATATDTTTIVAGDVVMTKSQSVNGAAATQGNAVAKPGDTIRYTILVRNTGGAPVNTVVVSDTTPAFTTYSVNNSAGVADPASFTIGTGAAVVATSAPANGAAGTIKWTIPTLNPGEVATVTFNVKING